MILKARSLDVTLSAYPEFKNNVSDLEKKSVFLDYLNTNEEQIVTFLKKEEERISEAEQEEEVQIDKFKSLDNKNKQIEPNHVIQQQNLKTEKKETIGQKFSKGWSSFKGSLFTFSNENSIDNFNPKKEDENNKYK